MKNMGSRQEWLKGSGLSFQQMLKHPCLIEVWNDWRAVGSSPWQKVSAVPGSGVLGVVA